MGVTSSKSFEKAFACFAPAARAAARIVRGGKFSSSRRNRPREEDDPADGGGNVSGCEDRPLLRHRTAAGFSARKEAEAAADVAVRKAKVLKSELTKRGKAVSSRMRKKAKDTASFINSPEKTQGQKPPASWGELPTPTRAGQRQLRSTAKDKVDSSPPNAHFWGIEEDEALCEMSHSDHDWEDDDLFEIGSDDDEEKPFCSSRIGVPPVQKGKPLGAPALGRTLSLGGCQTGVIDVASYYVGTPRDSM